MFVVVGGVLTLLTAMAVFDPKASIPLVSEMVCSAKRGTWTNGNGAWGIEARCYKRQGA